MTKTIQEVSATMMSLRAAHIVTERDREFEAQLLRQFQIKDGRMTYEPVRYTAGTETNGIAFIEGSGGGKTTAIIQVLRNFEPLALNPETGEPRYLHMKVESPATLHSLGVAILSKLDVEGVAARTKVYEIWNMVRVRLARRGVDQARGDIAAGVPLIEAALRAGFSDQSHMTRQFKAGYRTSVQNAANGRNEPTLPGFCMAAKARYAVGKFMGPMIQSPVRAAKLHNRLGFDCRSKRILAL